MLTGDELRRRAIVDLADLADRAGLAEPRAADEHVQPNGVDLSLDAVWRFCEPGVLSLDDAVRRIPAREELSPDADGWFDLAPATYGIRYAESVQMPTDCGGLCFPRSSLLRMGLTVPTAVWDAGYAGRGEGLLVVTNPHGVRLQRGARIAQLVVFRLTQPTEGYRGRYLNENRVPSGVDSLGGKPGRPPAR